MLKMIVLIKQITYWRILRKNIKYVLVLRKSAAGDANDQLRIDNTASSYAGGKYLITNDAGVNWTVYDEKDMLFEIWGKRIQ